MRKPCGYWADELPGVLIWALDGLARLRSQRGFTRSKWCESQKREARLDSDPARQFLMENVEFTGQDANALSVDALYKAYQSWANESGIKHPRTKGRFGRDVRAVFAELQESRTARPAGGGEPRRAWFGLKFKEGAEAGAVNAV